MSGHSPATIIRIEDLACPVPTPALAEAMRNAEIDGSEQRDDAWVLDQASAQTGLSDFGTEDFRERLRLWIGCVDADEKLNALGRAGMFAHFVRLAANRLRVENMLRRHPEILDVELPSPLIIAGLPRSGTTHLHNFVAADRRLRSLPYWESLEPLPKVAGEPDAVRIAEAQRGWDSFVAMCPHMPAMHEMSPEHANEEIELQQLDFSSYSLDWRIRAPAWRDYYLSHDQTPHYLYLRKILQLLTWLRGPNRWVLKCPQHMEQLIPVMRAFPDATVLLTHRDPVAVLRSALTMAAYTDRLRRCEVDLPALADFWVDRIERLLRACVRDRDSIPAEQVMDIRFEDFMADETGTLRKAYDRADLAIDPGTEARLDRYLAENRRGKHGKIIYDLKGDFGLDADRLRERYAFYCDRFDLTPEPSR